jgi:hypothetical protein
MNAFLSPACEAGDSSSSKACAAQDSRARMARRAAFASFVATAPLRRTQRLPASATSAQEFRAVRSDLAALDGGTLPARSGEEVTTMKCNVNPVDAAFRSGIGLLIVASPLIGFATYPYSFLGLVLVASGLSSFCPLYAAIRALLPAARSSTPARRSNVPARSRV